MSSFMTTCFGKIYKLWSSCNSEKVYKASLMLELLSLRFSIHLPILDFNFTIGKVL